MDHLTRQFLGSLVLGPRFFEIINPICDTLWHFGGPRYAILICKSYINMDHLGTNLDQFLWVPRIAEISPKFFEDN